jgi:DNA-binding XRE family transcriptional regulator
MTKQGGWEPTGFGRRLAELREEKGVSQAELAERAGCHRFTVSKLERGDQEPAWPLVVALCRALGVSCTDFEKAVASATEASPAPRRRGRPRKAPGGAAETQPRGRRSGS